jgi:Pectate lyase superfamily protein
MALTKATYSMISGAPVNVLDYGATGDGTTDDTAAIQSAINYAGTLNKPTQVIIPSGFTFVISVGVRTGIAAGVAGLVMRDYVTLVINGTLFAKAGIYGVGTLSALIKSPDVGNSYVTITGSGLIDGNKANQTASVQCDNIYLRAVYQVKVENIKCVNANGNGILIDKAVGGANHVDVSIINTMVANVNSIGIQVSHAATNLIITGNQVTTCTNNCIDVYNENGTVTADPGIITISNNAVAGGLTGIFPETTQNCSVVGNSIGSCTVGIQTNRVNGAPTNIVISSNNIYNCPTGIVGSGDTKGVLICDNTINAFNTAGVSLIGITVSSYTVHGNIFIPSATTTPIITLNGTTFVWNQIFNNVCEDSSHDTTKGIVLVAGTLGANTLEPIIYSNQIRPVKVSGVGTTTSGGTTAITVPSSVSGKLVIKSSAGGAWNSVWSGSFVSDSTRVTVAQESSTYTTPANNVSTVVGSASTLVITVTWAASGSAGSYNYWIEYI